MKIVYVDFLAVYMLLTFRRSIRAVVGCDRTGEDRERPRTGRMADQLFQSPEIAGPAPSCG